jgi:DNA-directed RNA polymerase subunit RPC12/RpoP
MLLTLQGGIAGVDMGQESSLHALPVVECPGCRTKMQVVGTEPAPNDQHSVTYRCNRCGTETVRVFKIPDE